jgi:hypothetical protein
VQRLVAATGLHLAEAEAVGRTSHLGEGLAAVGGVQQSACAVRNSRHVGPPRRGAGFATCQPTVIRENTSRMSATQS